MDKPLKVILLLFPIILVSAYFYSITYGIDSFDDILTGSVIGESVGASIFIIDCPEGYNEVTENARQPSSETTACVRSSANELTEVVLRCGDEYEGQGMVETVSCTMLSP